MPLVSSGMLGMCVCRAFERASRRRTTVLTPSDATKTAGMTAEPEMSHSVRALAMSSNIVKKRKTLRRIEGRNDFACSIGDRRPIATAAARSRAPDAIVAWVR